jgi:MFS family permease
MIEFSVSREIAVLPLALYTLGFAIGPTIAAPLSEIYGRRAIYWTSMPLLLVFQGISGAANNVPLLIVMRLLAGTGGSAALAVGAGIFCSILKLIIASNIKPGTVADLWDTRVQGPAAVFFILSPFLGPTLGPIIGAYIINEYHNDWRYSIWVVMIIAAPVAVAAAFMQETFKPRILYLRQNKPGVETPLKASDTKFRLVIRKLSEGLYRPLHMMFVEVRVREYFQFLMILTSSSL